MEEEEDAPSELGSEVEEEEVFDGEDGDEMSDGLDNEEDFEESEESEEEPTGIFTEDPDGLNDGFFSIDEFNKQTEFLEQADERADPYTGEASDEEDIDWDADPMTATAKPVSSSRRAAAMDIDDDAEESEEDDGNGPTFGNMDLNAPEGDSDDGEEDSEMDGEIETAGDNTNDVLYKDFFEPPARKAGKGELQANYLDRQSRKSKATEPDDEAGIERAMADVRRDLFDDMSDQADSEDALSEVDAADPKSRRSAHERRQAKLAEEIRRLEAASVAKREWTLSGEARAVDRPKDSLLEEDLDFERTGKPVPVITAEVSESIEDLIKRRILAQEFDEVVRRRPDSLSTPANTRRGAFELDDTKNPQSLAEMYEEEHVKAHNPDTYVSKADEKTQKEEKEIEAMWKDVSAKLDALSSWHYKPKPAAPSLTVVSDVATISMEDAQPTTASGMNGGESMLAPQEIYKAGQEKEKIEKGEVVPKSGAPVARQEMTREEKGGVEIDQRPEGKKSQKNRETLGDLKKGGVKVINKKGELQDVEGNKVQASTVYSGADNFTQLKKALGDKIVGTRFGFKPHSPWDDLVETANNIQKTGADLIITLGAGSLTDGVKVITFVRFPPSPSKQRLNHRRPLKTHRRCKNPQSKPPQIPVINIPTSLSGGEYSPLAGATDTRTKHKAGFYHPSMGADLIILDPALSVSTPERIWLSTGIRAVDHCVEGLCSTDPSAGPESDKAFIAGLKLLVPNLLLTKKNW
ncbi:U3 small nucleolar RNA-associated protein, partial [Lachnellula willkommii]